MANGKNKNNNKNNIKNSVPKKDYKKLLKRKDFLLTIIGVIIIVVIIIFAVDNPFHPPFSAPSSITSEKYYEVSSGDLLSNGQSGVFFLSWIGCPIGATDSWAIYSAINSTYNIYSHVELHSAYNKDIYSDGTTGQPGLLFTGNFTFTASGHSFKFYPLYMYNETMTGTVNNKSITAPTLEAYGLSLVNETYPSSVAKIFNKYATDITYDHHLTTTFLITGPGGTYIFNSFMYQPVSGGILGTGTSSAGDWAPHTPEYTMSHLSDSTTIKTAGDTFSNYLVDVK